VTIELGETEFIDSSGLGALLWSERRLRAVGGSLKVAGADGPVLQAFELAGLDGMLSD
jgi:anti-anti-sigma factor